LPPFEPYETKDGWVVIACGNDELFRKLARTLGMAQLADDPHFATNAQRSEHVLLLKATLEDTLRHHPTQHWLDLLLPAGIPCAPINDVGQAVHDPQVQARHMVLPVEDPSVAPLMVAGMPIKMSAYPDAQHRPAAPELDADRARIPRRFPLKRDAPGAQMDRLRCARADRARARRRGGRISLAAIVAAAAGPARSNWPVSPHRSRS